MSIESVGSNKSTEIVKSLSTKVKALVESVKHKDEPKMASDSIKTQIKPNEKLIPAKTIDLSKAVVKKVDSEKPILISKVTESNRKEFNELYSQISTSFTKRFSGEEAKIAVKILSNDKIRVAASDKEKVNLIRVISYEMEHAQKSDPKLYKELLEAVNKVVSDFESKGKMDTLTEYLFLELSNTGVMVLNMDDWAAKKITQHDKILSATSPHQKADLIYSLKAGYTAKSEESAINKIIKNSVDNGQFKDLMGQWSNLLDASSSNIDAIYKNLGGSRRTEFLEIVSEGMKKEHISAELMVHLYGADKVYDDLKNLSNAKRTEKEGKLSEAGKLYSEIGDHTKSKQLFLKAGNESYNKGDFLGVAGNYLSYTKSGVKSVASTLNSGLGIFEDVRALRATTSYIGDRTNEALKNYPTLQSKNIIAMKEERVNNLEKLSKIPRTNLSEVEKKAHNTKFESLIDKMTGTKAHTDNDVKLMIDGSEAYERLKSRIMNSKESIYMEAFIYHDDKVGNEFADLLIKKANEGLDVRVVIDSLTNTAEYKVLNKLKNSKVKFYEHKGALDNIIESRGMSAYHRKLYVFDKKVAMTGGMNIGDEYLTKGKWHDALVEVQGPIMSDTLNDFYKRWSFNTGLPLEKAPPPNYFKTNKSSDLKMDLTNGSSVRLVTTDPTEKTKNIKIWMNEAIKNAKERVYIQDPYFNDPEIIKNLKDAVARGVKVEVIFPNVNDVPIMRHLDDMVLDQLYTTGADLFSYKTSGREKFNHLKATVVDDMVSIGSSNKDVRALNTNQEINYVINDKKMADLFISRVWTPDKKNSEIAEPQPENFWKKLIKHTLNEMPSFF